MHSFFSRYSNMGVFRFAVIVLIYVTWMTSQCTGCSMPQGWEWLPEIKRIEHADLVVRARIDSVEEIDDMFITTSTANITVLVNYFLQLMQAILSVLLQSIDSLRLSDAFIRQWTGPSLVQIMTCPLFGTNPLSELMMAFCQLAA